jgi:hypothetical protein
MMIIMNHVATKDVTRIKVGCEITTRSNDQQTRFPNAEIATSWNAESLHSSHPTQPQTWVRAPQGGSQGCVPLKMVVRRIGDGADNMVTMMMVLVVVKKNAPLAPAYAHRPQSSTFGSYTSACTEQERDLGSCGH